ncbi:hypothetical protein C1J03_01060 [Sulfitobacter sp. SK012]|uniref:DUF3300 domain-containing protein n=1 Tax=Sulfitobacter sp. SK012 TaxID=1389005 RepID=UPI000E0A140A|nr:DUF3300 domain-containing protein [Sulfitobacter sp. SK012]AXI44741.1 hypothetical protein C1J03_01060 [Sulfitobacter sp. SK012]
MLHLIRLFLVFAIVFGAPIAQAQTDENTAEQDAPEASDEEMLTQTELENLVAPVALYPDTLLIQILVAATVPIEVVKSDRLLAENKDAEPEIIKAAIEAEEYDPSVEVLATAFPDVIADMATHIEWTETMGDAMLAQSDDVMVAVQTMRTQAINSGALISGEEQVVEVTEEETVIIQPTNPETVYVPQYDPQVVYVQDNNNNNGVSDALVTGAVVFGTVALIDAIFDDDDDWNNYWGCRNCGGWGGRPIYRNPDIDIDVDGNVNIGNKIDIDKTKIKNRGDRGADGSWKPNDRKKKDARNKISKKRAPDGKSKLPTKRKASKTDNLRGQLSAKSGASDISRPNAKPSIDGLGSKNRPAAKRDKTRKAAAKTAKPKKSAAKRSAAKKPAARKPAATKKRAAHKKPAAHKQRSATKRHSSAGRSKAGSGRGRSSGNKRRGRR